MAKHSIPNTHSPKPERCKAKTLTGKRCLLVARKSGFCVTHEIKAERDIKKSRYKEIIDIVLRVCQSKRWHAHLSSTDDDWQIATISLSKYFEHEEVRGLFHITINDGIRYRVERTSFHNYGLKDLLDSVSVKLHEVHWLESGDKKKGKISTEPKTSVLIARLLKNFDKAARQLERRHNNRSPFIITDEYDTQDILHSVLRAYFDDVRPEEYVPSYAGSASKVDFLLKNEGAVIEVKYATNKLKEKMIGEQLIIDIKRYQTHPNCKELYCLVYDPKGIIRNPTGFENDLSGRHNELLVGVFVVPH